MELYNIPRTSVPVFSQMPLIGEQYSFVLDFAKAKFIKLKLVISKNANFTSVVNHTLKEIIPGNDDTSAVLDFKITFDLIEATENDFRNNGNPYVIPCQFKIEWVNLYDDISIYYVPYSMLRNRSITTDNIIYYLDYIKPR